MVGGCWSVDRSVTANQVTISWARNMIILSKTSDTGCHGLVA